MYWRLGTRSKRYYETLQGLYLAAQEGIQQSLKVKLLSTFIQFFSPYRFLTTATYIDISCRCYPGQAGTGKLPDIAATFRRTSEAYRFAFKGVSFKIHEVLRRNVSPDREG